MRERHGIAPNRVFEKVSGAGCTQSNTKQTVDKPFHELLSKVFI